MSQDARPGPGSLAAQPLVGPSSAEEWTGGWWRHARACPSPNFGPRPPGESVTLAVIHSISLPPGEYGGGWVEQFFQNRLDVSAHPYFQSIANLKVSAHFFIERGGSVIQFVSAHDRAWHAGQSRHEGRDGCNDFSVGIELEGLEGLTFEPAQYDALARLLASLARAYPLSHLAGHEHIAPGRKADPGPGFDWARLRRLSQGSRWRWPAA